MLDNVHLLQVVHRYHNYPSVIDYIDIKISYWNIILVPNATQLNIENL